MHVFLEKLGFDETRSTTISQPTDDCEPPKTFDTSKSFLTVCGELLDFYPEPRKYVKRRFSSDVMHGDAK